MQNKYNFAAINTTLYNIRKNKTFFENISIIIKNNFVQTIFVVF